MLVLRMRVVRCRLLFYLQKAHERTSNLPETKCFDSTGTHNKIPYSCKLEVSGRGDFLSRSRGALSCDAGKVVVEGKDTCWTW